MNIQTKDNFLVITHHLKRNENYKISKSSKFQTISIYKKPKVCLGFSSRTEDNKDILLLDYDNVAYSILIEDLDFLFNLNHFIKCFYIFKTDEYTKNNQTIGNYHVVCLQKYNIHQLIRLINKTHSDLAYLDSPLRNIYRSYVLRISSKGKRERPQFKEVYINPKSHIKNMNISTAHKNLLSKLYPEISHPSYFNEDKLNIFKLQEYETS
jgi:hypothetical protein